MNEQSLNIAHEVKLIDRNILSITGVNKIISFDSNEFLLESNMGPIHITGNALELQSLDTHDGIIRIKGKVSGYNYLDKTTKKKDDSFISKLFKWVHISNYYCYYLIFFMAS